MLDTNNWQKVTFGSFNVDLSYFTISFESVSSLEPRISAVTADACIPRPRKFFFSLCISHQYVLILAYVT